MPGFVNFAADAIKTKDGLDCWVCLALEYNEESDASSGNRRRSRTPHTKGIREVE